MAEISYRDAMTTALREALREDDRMFIMGEDIGLYGGSYAVTKGFVEEFGRERVIDTPISESVIVGAGTGSAKGGMHPVVEIMTINFTLLAMGPDRQPRRQAPLHVRRTVHCPHDHTHRHRWRRAARRYPLPEPGGLVRLRAGIEGRDTGHSLRCPRPLPLRA